MKKCGSNSILKTPQVWQSCSHTQASKTCSCYNTASVITPEANEKLPHNFPLIQSKERIVETARTGTVCLGRDSKPSEKPKPNENKQKPIEKPTKTLCRLCYNSLPCSDLPKVRPWWHHAGFHNKLIGSFAFVGCRTSLSHFALGLSKVQLRHSRAALLLGVSRNAFPLLGFGGRHTEGQACSPRTANFNATWTLSEPPLKSHY